LKQTWLGRVKPGSPEEEDAVAFMDAKREEELADLKRTPRERWERSYRRRHRRRRISDVEVTYEGKWDRTLATTERT
jgi:hypothetical protein